MNTQERIQEICRIEPLFKYYTVDDIVASSDYCFGELTVKNRNFDILTVRHVCIVIKLISEKKVHLVGDFFNQDHSTVIHTVKVVLNALQGYDKKRKKRFIEILQSTNRLETNVFDFEPKALLTLQAKFNQLHP